MKQLAVRDLMSDDVIAVRPEDDLACLHGLMIENDVRHIPVVNTETELVGLVSHRDLLRASLIEQPNVTGYMEKAILERVLVHELMTEDVESVDADADLRDAAEVMVENKYGCLPVTEGRRLRGILTESDFVRFMARGE
ncbi:MAG: CBS domain-containing protein [Acidobacteriota bacterium]